jgi:hypothetical protein
LNERNPSAGLSHAGRGLFGLCLRPIVGERDIHPVPGEMNGHGGADAFPAGDERNAIAELHVAKRL